MKNFFFTFLLFFAAFTLHAQTFRVYGKITNNKLEPLAFASIQIKETQSGVITKEDGSYELNLEVGQYNLVISMVGYKTQVINLVLNKDYQQNIILDEANSMDELIIKVKAKDRAEEIIKNIIHNKDNITGAAGNYSCRLYIKAVQQDSTTRKRDRKIDSSLFKSGNADLQGMAMKEELIHLDYESNQHLKEQRLGVKENGKTPGLFYSSVTDGDFSLYNNLIKVPKVSPTPFLSPISFSGLLAYRFKTLKIEKVDGHKIYTISVKPRQISNATVEGEITVADSLWVILHAHFSFPSYHLPEYDFFEVDQEYSYVQNKAWLLSKQQFNYYSKAGKNKLSGQTLVVYNNYELNKTFPKNYFGNELSATTDLAYDRDSAFWQTVRTVPLTDKEIRFVRYKDSMFQVMHTKAFLDSMDRANNRITWSRIGLWGQTFYKRDKERTIVIPALVSLYEPFQFGGSRIHPQLYYYQRFPSRKDITLYTDLSYGLRNHDINGSIQLKRMYNPFNHGFYKIEAIREFDHIYEGDAWINQIQRSSYFLNNYMSLQHGIEVFNGLLIYTEVDYALRRSLVGYETNPAADSILKNYVTLNGNNQPINFTPFNALYGKFQMEYTPFQKYMREPKEKIILGSKWPTFFMAWRKGISGVLKSNVNFDYVEYGIKQKIQIGVLGILHYNIKTGTYLNTSNLDFLDYHYERRGDPLLFMNPDLAFQSLDSTFPVFHRFYEGHIMHEFNGALINKIPLLKKLQLREIAGGGFLIAPERKLTYAEVFGGVERVFKWPFDPLMKFKVGAYVVGSDANNFKNPIQFKVGFTIWDKLRNRWR